MSTNASIGAQTPLGFLLRRESQEELLVVKDAHPSTYREIILDNSSAIDDPDQRRLSLSYISRSPDVRNSLSNDIKLTAFCVVAAVGVGIAIGALTARRAR
ncbi:hypothetical protein FA15DRAFT_669403 [Coprinopsis marcescibilis]|uniref:Uncharacterized protein n=1 Tax=Coprinopsis marcescibilis TaxID=230819 RepID=A0A5C3KWV3_COPMA|nr:hypothetical protein FA15DRAFT_669403 [Coprinopsis marcescibilis]